MRGPARAGATLAAVACLLVQPVAGQSLTERTDALDGAVAFHFEGREGVEGCGDGSISFGSNRWERWTSDRDPRDCGPGPVLVQLTLSRGAVQDVDTRVGPRVLDELGSVRDLGWVSPAEGAEYLLAIAESGPRAVASEAILPAFLARDVTVWPRLIELARDRSRPEEVRSQALFWVGQEAAGVGTSSLAEFAQDEDEDHEVREAAVFALSQRPEEEGMPILMELARNATDADTRRSAMFWLAQSDDPQVVDFFEDLLVAGR